MGSGERGGTNRVKTKPNETKRKLAPLAADKEEAEQQEEAQTEAETVSFPLPLPHFPLPCHLPCDEASERPKERKKERSASRRGRATNYMSIEKVPIEVCTKEGECEGGSEVERGRNLKSTSV